MAQASCSIVPHGGIYMTNEWLHTVCVWGTFAKSRMGRTSVKTFHLHRDAEAECIRLSDAEAEYTGLTDPEAEYTGLPAGSSCG